MLIQLAVYFVLSILAVLCATYVHVGITYVDWLYSTCNAKLAPFLEHPWIRNVFILLVLPLAIAAIPALIYRLIKKQNMPYFLEITWGLWLIFVLSNLLIQ